MITKMDVYICVIVCTCVSVCIYVSVLFSEKIVEQNTTRFGKKVPACLKLCASKAVFIIYDDLRKKCNIKLKHLQSNSNQNQLCQT